MKLTRRRFLTSLPLFGGVALGVKSIHEPHFIETKRLDLRRLGIGKRIVQFSDLHYRGDRKFGDFPIVGDRGMGAPYDLILAGYSHGGQVRLPLVGALCLPPAVGRYVRGFYEVPAGNLYVNVGEGTYLIPIRFFAARKQQKF